MQMVHCCQPVYFLACLDFCFRFCILLFGFCFSLLGSRFFGVFTFRGFGAWVFWVLVLAYFVFLVCLLGCLASFLIFLVCSFFSSFPSGKFCYFLYTFQLIFNGHVHQPNSTVAISALSVAAEICTQHNKTLHPPIADPGKQTLDDMQNYILFYWCMPIHI